jgi:hypothetical protein
MKLIPYIIAVIAITWAVLATTCSGPVDNSDLIRENDSLRVASVTYLLRSENLSRQRVAAELQTRQTKKSYDSTSKIKDARIAYYRSHPKVIEVIKEIPVIDSAFQAYDSSLAAKDNRIWELEGELYNSLKLAQQAEVNFNDLIRTKNAEIKNKDEQIALLTSKKRTFKDFLKKLRNYTIAGAIGAAAVKVADELKD